MIWDFMNPHKISANSDNKQKSFVPKKKIFGMLVFVTLKNTPNKLYLLAKYSAFWDGMHSLEKLISSSSVRQSFPIRFLIC